MAHAQTPDLSWFKSKYTEVDTALLKNLQGTKWKCEYIVHRGVFRTRLTKANFNFEVNFIDTALIEFNQNSIKYTCTYLRHMDGLGIQFDCGKEKGGYKIVKLTNEYMVVNIRVLSRNGKSLKNTRKRYVFKRT